MIRKLNILRDLRLAAAAAAFAAAISSCSDSTTSSLTGDSTAPSVSLTKTSTTADSVVAFTVGVKDNLGIKTIHVRSTGGITAAFDTTFTSANTDVTLPFALVAPKSVPPGSPVIITASAMDGAGNVSPVDTLKLTVGNLPPPVVLITSPAAGTFAVVGKSIVVSVSGKTAVRLRSLGFLTTGAVTTTDSAVYNSPLKDSVAVQDTIAIPANATPGPLVITPFLIDSLGQKSTGPSVTVTVQTAAAANSIPVVQMGHTARVEVTDTIHVEATDQAGVTTLGYEVRRAVGGAIDIADSVNSNGQLTSQIKTFVMGLPYTSFPTTIYIQAFARNATGTRAYAKLSGGADRVDTVTVVAGVTRPLPLGGLVADALYHPRTDRLYLTNILRNQVEVFSLTDSAFKSPVNVGSRPWGIAAWPRDRQGTMGDTLLIANSGGTDVSYVNINTSGSGTEMSRYALPNIIAYTITTVTSTTSTAQIQQRTKYDFSDRPQFLGATCKDAGGGVCGDVVLTYSTTPTGGQSVPFDHRNGTLRWENLTQHTSHFFFEQAIGQSTGRVDTLEVVRYDANNPNDSTILVPYRQKIGSGSDTTRVSVVVRINDIAFRDTTYVRNSGNFQRAVMAEGGAVVGSRALVYDVSLGMRLTALTPAGVNAPLPIPFYDNGASGSSNVTDFIANTFQTVSGAAINFDGSLSAIRGDSTYVINPLLRLQGVLQTTAGNAGLDFHPRNTGPNSAPLSSRLIFAASTEPFIDIYDSHCYQRVGQIPIRDPIIGPVTAALRSSGQLVLVAATARGVVIAALPNTFTTSCP